MLTRTRVLNQLYGHLAVFGLEAPLFRARNRRRLLMDLASRPLPAEDPELAVRALIVQQLARQVLQLDADICALTQRLTALARRVAPALLTVPGLGELTAAKIIAEVAMFAASPPRRSLPYMPASLPSKRRAVSGSATD